MIMHRGSAALLLPVADRERGSRKQRRATKYISLRQATNIIEAVNFSRLIDLPLVAHLTLHWSLTDVADDPDGKLFAKLREGLDKWLNRHGIEFAAVWARERQSRGQSDVVHCHLMFHLPEEYRAGRQLQEVETAICRLIERHGRGITHEAVTKLVIYKNPDGKYLIKGGGPKVWKKFRLRKQHRRLQGFIHGNRCGVTENIGPAERKRYREQQEAPDEMLKRYVFSPNGPLSGGKQT
jgi:hypothetical protein